MNQEQSINIKKDLIIALIIGEVLAWLILILTKEVLPQELYAKIKILIFTLPIYLPVVCAVCLYIAYLISKKIGFIYQVAKFVLVGGFNTLVDWGVLALLILVFKEKLHVSSDQTLLIVFFVTITFYTLYKSLSFIVALISSYLWNKYWTFTRKTKEQAAKEFGQFFIVSILGFLINVGIASWVFVKIAPIGNLTSEQWGITSAVVATAISMFWNFVGYKFFVFDDKKTKITD